MSDSDGAAGGQDTRITAVIFDFHATAASFGDPRGWLSRAWVRAGRRGTPEEVLGEGQVHRLSRLIRGMRDDLRDVEPEVAQLTAERHRQLFHQLAVRLEWIDDDLAAAMYDTLMEAFIPYDDAVPTLVGLKERDVEVGLVSTIEVDVRPMLAGMQLTHLFDVVVRAAQPRGADEARVVGEALGALRARPSQTLVVGDDWAVGRAASEAGVMSLVVPPAPGPRHGLSGLLQFLG
jgi:phosphoglycolate phosphatase-like HAD superfamily hydrolase